MDYICYNCETVYNLENEDYEWCPYCGSEIKKIFSVNFFNLKGRYEDMKEKYKDLPDEKTIDTTAKKIADYEKENKELDKEYAEVIKNIEKFEDGEALCRKLYKNKIYMEKYRELLGDDFIRDKVYFDMEDVRPDEIYNNFILLPKEEFKGYDGINGFEEMSFERAESFFKKIPSTEKKQMFVRKNDGRIFIYPGWYFFKDGFEMSKVTTYNRMFDVKIKNEIEEVEEGEKPHEIKTSATVVPAEFEEDNNIYYKLKRKGLITFINTSV